MINQNCTSRWIEDDLQSSRDVKVWYLLCNASGERKASSSAGRVMLFFLASLNRISGVRAPSKCI